MMHHDNDAKEDQPEQARGGSSRRDFVALSATAGLGAATGVAAESRYRALEGSSGRNVAMSDSGLTGGPEPYVLSR